jgi:hypothetical protein
MEPPSPERTYRSNTPATCVLSPASHVAVQSGHHHPKTPARCAAGESPSPSDSISRWTPCPPRGSRHEAAGICPACCLRIPPARVRRDFHPQEKRPAGRTINKAMSEGA